MAKVNVYQIVTDRILGLLDKGVIPWQKPWAGEAGAPKSLQTGKSYRGVEGGGDANGHSFPHLFCREFHAKLLKNSERIYEGSVDCKGVRRHPPTPTRPFSR